MTSTGPLSIRRANLTDAGTIAALGAQTFSDAFGPDNRPEDMNAYLHENFSRERIAEEISASGSIFLIVLLRDEPIGYALLRRRGQMEVKGPRNPIELARIYIQANLIGSGYGSMLMEACLEEARRMGHDAIWLGVWQKNEKAIRFYSRWGFDIIGTQKFHLGADIQDDFVMMRVLE